MTAMLLRPSSAPIWGNCSGSVSMSMNCPEKIHPRTEQGTAAHWVAEQCLKQYKDPSGGAPLCSDWLDKTAPNGVVVDDEMTAGAQALVSDVLKVCNDHGGLGHLLVEHPVYMPQIHHQNGGTLDVCLPMLEHGMIYIWDYKHGHRQVDVKDNFQLIDYCAGIVNAFNINGAMDQNITVVFRIVQPYCYQNDGPIQEYSCVLSDLRGVFNHLNKMAHEALTCPTLSAGRHCRDCPGNVNCPAARKVVYDLADYVDLPLEVDNMSAADMATERMILSRTLELAKSRLEAIEDNLVSAVRKGDTSAGLALANKKGRKKWTKPLVEVLAAGSMFGVDLRQNKPVTPLQAIDLVDVSLQEHFISTIETMTENPISGLKLVDSSETVGARAFKKR